MRLTIPLAWAAAVALLPAAGPPPILAIRNARIVTVSGPVLPRATLVVRNGLIAEVGENVTPPAEAWVIEGEGLTVYPGLIDGLSNAGLPAPAPPAPVAGGAAPAAAAGPAPRGPQDRPANTSWKRAADELRATEAKIAAFRAAGFTSAAVFPMQGLVAGQGALVNLAGESAGQMVVASPVGQYVRLAPTGFRTFPSSRMGVTAYLRQLYLDLEHYQRQKRAHEANPRGTARPPYDRALEGLAESPRLLFPAERPHEVERAARFARELGRPAILHGLHGGYGAVEALKGLGAVVSTKWPTGPAEADPEAPQELRELEFRDNAATTPARLAAAGIRFAFTSDGQTAAEMLRGVRRAMTRGLKPDDALRALTLWAAELYGVGDRAGSLEKGKIANLVVTKNDLLAERPEIQFVMVDGVKYAPVEPPAARPGRTATGAAEEEEEEDPE